MPGTCPHRCASSSAPSVPVTAAQRAPQPGTAQRQVRPGAPAEGSVAVCARRPRERPGVDEGGAARGPLPPRRRRPPAVSVPPRGQPLWTGASGTAVVLFEVARFERLAGLSGHEENKEKIKTTKRLDNDQEQKGRAGRGRPEQTAAPWRPGRRQVGPCLGTRGAGTAGPPRGRRARGSAEGLGTFGVRREHRPRADDAHTVVYLCLGHRVCLRRVSPAPGAVNHGSTLWGPRSGCNPGTFDFSDLHAPHPTPRRGHHTLCGSAGEVAGTVGP